MNNILILSLLLCIINKGRGLSVFWVGNSYTYYNDLPSIVDRLAKADDTLLEFDSHTEGGWTWDDHAHSKETLDKIASKPWDVVVLQEYSTRPAYPEEIVCRNTVANLNILVEKIRTSNPHTRLQYYLTWGRPFGLDSECPSYPQFCQYSSMQDHLTESYTTFACMTKSANVAPVGEAFRLVKELLGDETFYSLYQTGGVLDHHPTIVGSYLSGLLHYLALFPDRNVVGNTETLGLDQDTVDMLQEIAMLAWNGLGVGYWQFGVDSECQLSMCDE